MSLTEDSSSSSNRTVFKLEIVLLSSLQEERRREYKCPIEHESSMGEEVAVAQKLKCCYCHCIVCSTM